MLYAMLFTYAAISIFVGYGGLSTLLSGGASPRSVRMWISTLANAFLWPLLPLIVFGRWSVRFFTLDIYEEKDPLKKFLAQYQHCKTIADIPNIEPIKTPATMQIGNANRKRIVNAWLAHFGSRCPDCGVTMDKTKTDGTKPTIDHIFARSLGGTHDLQNLRICCEKCNKDKGLKELEINHLIRHQRNVAK